MQLIFLQVQLLLDILSQSTSSPVLVPLFDEILCKLSRSPNISLALWPIPESPSLSTSLDSSPLYAIVKVAIDRSVSAFSSTTLAAANWVPAELRLLLAFQRDLFSRVSALSDLSQSRAVHYTDWLINVCIPLLPKWASIQSQPSYRCVRTILNTLLPALMPSLSLFSSLLPIVEGVVPSLMNLMRHITTLHASAPSLFDPEAESHIPWLIDLERSVCVLVTQVRLRSFH